MPEVRFSTIFKGPVRRLRLSGGRQRKIRSRTSNFLEKQFAPQLGLAPRNTEAMQEVMRQLQVARGFQVNAGDGLIELKKGVYVGGLQPTLEALRLRP